MNCFVLGVLSGLGVSLVVAVVVISYLYYRADK